MRIQIDKIQTKRGLFLRNNYNRDAIERYKELFLASKSKQILVSKINKEYILVDGFHRLKAAQELKHKVIDSKIEIISEKKLRERAVEENLKHGVALSKEERNNIIKDLRIRDEKTEKEIGKIFSLTQERIGQILKKMNVEETSIFHIHIIREYFKDQNQKQTEIA